jgi:hypothetical protein
MGRTECPGRVGLSRLIVIMRMAIARRCGGDDLPGRNDPVGWQAARSPLTIPLTFQRVEPVALRGSHGENIWSRR